MRRAASAGRGLGLARDRVEISANRAIVKENERCPQIYVVESGWVFRSRGLASGRRQIVNYALLYGKTAFTLAKDIGVSQ